MTGRAWRGVALGASAAMHALAALAFLGTRITPPSAPDGGALALVWLENAEGAAGAEPSGAAAESEAPPTTEPVAAEPAAPAEQPARRMDAPQAATAPPDPGRLPAEAALPPPPPPAPPRRTAPRAEGSRSAPVPAPNAPEGVGGGANASGAVVPPRPLATAQNPPPAYPAMSRRNGEQGRVTLRVAVDPEGRVLGIEVVETSGHLALDEAARRAVREWRFQPAMQDGRPVLASARVGITFRLEGDRPW